MRISGKIFKGMKPEDLIAKPLIKDDKIVGEITSTKDDCWFGEIFDKEIERLMTLSDQVNVRIQQK